MSYKRCRGRVLFSKENLFAFVSTYFRQDQQKRKLVSQFESVFAEYIGVEYGIAVSCGKIALYLCLKALGSKKGDEIIVPAYTVPEVIDVIVISGLRPIFVDINLQDGNMDVSLIEGRIGKHTKFILMTHIYGNPCDVDKILEIAKKYNLEVIEDAAQACGAEYKEKKIGSFGKIGYFSFGILKNFNTLGGAMIVTNDYNHVLLIRNLINNFGVMRKKELLKRLLTTLMLSFFTHPLIFAMFVYPMLSIKGFLKKEKINTFFESKVLSMAMLNRLKIRFTAEQAAIGLVQINNIDRLNAEKIKKAKLLNAELSSIDAVGIFKEKIGIKNIYLNYVIRINNREKLVKHLFKHGIDVAQGNVVSCASLKRFSEFYCDCPNSKRLDEQNLYLPIYSPLKTGHIREMAQLIKVGL